MDLLATVLATCVLSIMAILAQRIEVDLAGTTATIEKVMSTDAPRRIVALPLTISIPIAPPEEARRKLEQAARSCPVHHSLPPDMEKPITIQWGTGKS